ncbi:uncharacterized protein FFMR_07226 [Fusarium fujikuroi]|nr:uncharacterized protein FFMR_07226 [Fusarium fujikuroi]
MAQDTQTIDGDTFFGLPSAWRQSFEFSQHGVPGRFEGEITDLVVLGDIPKEININGTFYRIMVDPLYLLMLNNPAIEGDERLKLERQAKKRLFGLYRNFFMHHPCIRAAIDSTANINRIY